MIKKKVKAVLVDSEKPIVLGDIMKCIKLSPIYEHGIDKKIGDLVLNINPRVTKSDGYFKKQEIVLISTDNDEIVKGDKVYFGSKILIIEETVDDTVTFVNPYDNKLQTLCGKERFKKVIVEHDNIGSSDISKLIEKFNNKENTELWIEMIENYDCILDKYKNKILEGDFIDFQGDIVKVYIKESKLAIYIYDEEYYITECFRNDFNLCDHEGNYLTRENDCELKNVPYLYDDNVVNILYICELLQKDLITKEELIYILKQYELNTNRCSEERADRLVKNWLSQFEK